MTKVLSCAIRTRGDRGGWKGENHIPKLEIGTDIANTITSASKDSMVIIIEDETDRIIQLFNYETSDKGMWGENPEQGRVYSPFGVCPTITSTIYKRGLHILVEDENGIRIEELIKITKMKTDKIIQLFNIVPDRKGFDSPQEGRVYSPFGIAPTVLESGGCRMIKVLVEHPNGIPMEEIKCNRLYNIYGFDGMSYAGNVFDPTGIAPTINTMGGGNREPMVIIEDNKGKTMAQDIQTKLPKELQGKKFRVRKLTERELFRLFGVTEKDIDTIQATGISKSSQQKLAGNSIVVDVLFHIFRKLFIETDIDKSDKPQQLSLF